MLWLEKAAQQGYAPAQTSIGNILWERANSVDEEWQARAWLLKAAEQGDAYAQYLLARTYINVSSSEAVEWYNKSAEQGFAPSQLGLGLSYWGTDYDKAVQWLQIASEHGMARAKTYLGYAYADGLGGLPKDDNSAVRLWREAAAQNEPRAEEALV